jgi:hypothetical protein
MPSTRRVELELQILEAKRASLQSQKDHEVKQYNLCGTAYDSVELDAKVTFLTWEQDKIAVAIAEKNLELFEIQGA